MIRQAKKPLGAYWQLIAGMIIWILLDALFSRTLISNDLALAAYAITVILTIIVIIRAVAKFKEESYDAARAKTSITKNVMIGHNRMSVDKDTVFGRDVYHQDDAIGNESEESGKLKKNDDE